MSNEKIRLSTDDDLFNDEPEEYTSPYDTPEEIELYNDNYDD